MQIWQGKPTFLDAYGDRLVAGRVVVYKLRTTTLADIWADEGFTVPLSNPLSLGSGGWWENQPYVDESVTIHVQEYLGLDGMNTPIYSDVQEYDLLKTDAITSESGNLIVVDTIADLKNLTNVQDQMIVDVLGYFSVGDCYVRRYIYFASDVQLDNGGTVVKSNVYPSGSWILQVEGNRLDVGCFGVIAGIADVNSQMRAAQGWATINGYTLVIPKGTYNYSASGTYESHCALDVADGVVFHRGNTQSTDEGTWYVWTLFHPSTVIRSTLAGNNVKLVIDGQGWQSTSIPITAFNWATGGFDSGNGRFNLILNDTTRTYTWNSSKTYTDIIINEGTHNLNVDLYNVYANGIKGVGKIAYATSSTIRASRIRTSNFDGRQAEQMSRATEMIYLDSDVALYAGFTTTAFVWAEGLGGITTFGSTTMTGGYGGSKKSWIKGTYGINLGSHVIDASCWSNGSNLVSTYNLSQTTTLDMSGFSTTGIVTKSGTIKNGVVASILASDIVLDNVTINGQVDSTTINAYRSVFNYPSGNPVPNVTSLVANKCVITGNTSNYVNLANSTVTDTVINGNTIATGGNVKGRNLTINGGLWIVPNSSKYANSIDLDNVNISGGLTFDASIMSSTGEANMYTTYIRGNVGSILSINGATKKWSINGHSNVIIDTNKGSTVGSAKAVITKMGGAINGYGYAATDKIFVLRTDNTLEADSVVVMDVAYGNTYSGGNIQDSPRAVQLTWFGQSGTAVYTGQKLNIMWSIYPRG